MNLKVSNTCYQCIRRLYTVFFARNVRVSKHLHSKYFLVRAATENGRFLIFSGYLVWFSVAVDIWRKFYFSYGAKFVFLKTLFNYHSFTKTGQISRRKGSMSQKIEEVKFRASTMLYMNFIYGVKLWYGKYVKKILIDLILTDKKFHKK